MQLARVSRAYLACSKVHRPSEAAKFARVSTSPLPPSKLGNILSDSRCPLHKAFFSVRVIVAPINMRSIRYNFTTFQNSLSLQSFLGKDSQLLSKSNLTLQFSFSPARLAKNWWSSHRSRKEIKVQFRLWVRALHGPLPRFNLLSRPEISRRHLAFGWLGLGNVVSRPRREIIASARASEFRISIRVIRRRRKISLLVIVVCVCERVKKLARAVIVIVDRYEMSELGTSEEAEGMMRAEGDKKEKGRKNRV